MAKRNVFDEDAREELSPEQQSPDPDEVSRQNAAPRCPSCGGKLISGSSPRHLKSGLKTYYYCENRPEKCDFSLPLPRPTVGQILQKGGRAALEALMKRNQPSVSPVPPHRDTSPTKSAPAKKKL